MGVELGFETRVVLVTMELGRVRRRKLEREREREGGLLVWAVCPVLLRSGKKERKLGSFTGVPLSWREARKRKV